MKGSLKETIVDFHYTVEPCLAATSVIGLPCYYGHVFWLGETAIVFHTKKIIVNAVTN